MLKRKRTDEDLPRKKRLHAASVDLLKRDWIKKEVLTQDGITRRADGSFVLRMQFGVILTKSQVDEIVRSVVTDTEKAFVKFKADTDGALTVSVELEYPPKSALRREERAKVTDPWYKNLDLIDKASSDVTAFEVWSNELFDVPEYDHKVLLTVHQLKDKDTYAIHLVRPLLKSSLI